MARPHSIACLQTQPQPGFQAALDEALPMAGAAVEAGAEFLFLPEYCGGLKAEGSAIAPPAAAEAEHPVLAAFRAFAAERAVWVMLGSIAVAAPNGRIFNRGYVLNDRGGVEGHYDKLHLFDIQISETEVYRESDRVSPGAAAVLYDTPIGRIGHTICYDLRFPLLYRALAQAGAEILTCPAAFTKTTGQAHWHILNRARSVENGAFMVSPCAVGQVPEGGETFGHSLIVDPWGEVLADGGTAPGVVAATINLDRVAEVRAQIPSLTHDRPYAPASAPVAAQ